MERPAQPARTALQIALALGLASAGLLATACGHGHTQATDFSYVPPVVDPAYSATDAPLVLIDEGHCNFHTADGRYRPFAELLRGDGFVVEGLNDGFTVESLAVAEVLVIANALSEANCEKWRLPNPPAFSRREIATVVEWVEGGGALLLIADHMPFPGAAAELASAFGLVFIDGYARPDDGSGPGIRFDRQAGTLAEHAVTAGRSDAERVEAVVSFTGQGFRAVGDAVPILTLPPATTLRLPREAGEFPDDTPSFSAEGLLQGAVLLHGAGRVAVFGEAAMFSAQEISRDGELYQFGMNAPGAEENAQFVLNVLHWLTGLID